MSTLWTALGGVLVLLLVGWAASRRRVHLHGRGRGPGFGGARATGPGGDHPAERLDTLVGWPPQATRILSVHERKAYAMLVRALPDHLVLAQVPVARFISVPKRNSYADWLRRVGYQCVDLIVCDMTTQVVAAIELQAAQPTERARKRLSRIARTLKAADLPLHVWREDALPAFETLRVTVLPTPRSPLLSPTSPPSPFSTRPTQPGAAATAPPSSSPATTPLHWNDPDREPIPDETIELLDPPPSTWYDDLDSQKLPLGKT